jgi:hypothetical protein
MKFAARADKQWVRIESSSIAVESVHVLASSIESDSRIQVRPPRRESAASTSQTGDSIEFTDLKTMVARWLMEFVTGKKARVVVPARMGNTPVVKATVPQASNSQAAEVSYTQREIVRETESTAFRAAGQVTLATGETVSFSLGLDMNREMTQVNSASFQTGDMTDPIAVNLDGAGVRLSGERQKFDLDSDGADELIATLAAGSAWLAHDADGNGRVNNGSELFGPTSGDGFAELKRLDADGNGWIDEADAGYANLGLWAGGEFTSLRTAGIGALSVTAVSTPFEIQEGGETLGQVRQSSVYLNENGSPGALEQVDLNVQEAEA